MHCGYAPLLEKKKPAAPRRGGLPAQVHNELNSQAKAPSQILCKDDRFRKLNLWDKYDFDLCNFESAWRWDKYPSSPILVLALCRACSTSARVCSGLQSGRREAPIRPASPCPAWREPFAGSLGTDVEAPAQLVAITALLLGQQGEFLTATHGVAGTAGQGRIPGRFNAGKCQPCPRTPVTYVPGPYR